jgi:hypothetical protein
MMLQHSMSPIFFWLIFVPTLCGELIVMIHFETMQYKNGHEHLINAEFRAYLPFGKKKFQGDLLQI